METIYKGVDADGRKVYELKFPEGFGLVHPDASDQPTPNPDEQQLRDYMNSYPEFYRLMHGDKNKSQ
jgi:hypothetical protein